MRRRQRWRRLFRRSWGLCNHLASSCRSNHGTRFVLVNLTRLCCFVVRCGVRFVRRRRRVRRWGQAKHVEFRAIVVVRHCRFRRDLGCRLACARRFERLDSGRQDRVLRPHSSELLLDRCQLLVRGIASVGASHGHDCDSESADEDSHS